MPFVVLEGVDGAGKTTQIEKLKSLFPNALFTREPGGSELGEQLRHIMKTMEMLPLTEMLLMSAARNEHVHNLILPALKSGRLVICDRFVYSTYAYQGARGVPEQHISAVQSAIGTPKPDLVFLFSHKYRDQITDRLEDGCDINYYEPLRDETWIDVPHGTPDEVTEFLKNHISSFLSDRA